MYVAPSYTISSCIPCIIISLPVSAVKLSETEGRQIGVHLLYMAYKAFLVDVRQEIFEFDLGRGKLVANPAIRPIRVS